MTMRERKKEIVAMLLAGGEGSRLGVLTEKIAKPAVPFGGKYRIIDFTLSNCSNSGIDTVGVLTQYQPLVLSSHIGVGAPWGLDSKEAKVAILPPFIGRGEGGWYKGTANAVYHNIKFVDQYDPDYVLIISGDHIYKMDYSLMLAFHKQKHANASVAVTEVPWGEASRFGLVNTGADGGIIEFEEKPESPQSNLASMGVYIFDWKLLREYLIKDAQDSSSQHDFGKNIIPRMLADRRRLFAYRFQGYWKDVGTIASLWEAHMDLLEEEPELDLHDRQWPVYSVNTPYPPQDLADEARVTCSIISDGCQVQGEVEHSVLFAGVRIEKGARVKDSVIMPGAVIGPNACVEKAIVAEGLKVASGAHIADSDGGIVLVTGDVGTNGRWPQRNAAVHN